MRTTPRMLGTMAIAATLAGTVAFGQGFGGPGRRGPHPPGAGVGGLVHAVEQLDLTDQQQTDVGAILDGSRTATQTMMQQMAELHETLRTTVAAGPFDEIAVRSLADQLGDLHADLIVEQSRSRSQVLALLTDEQRVELEALAAERRPRRRHGGPRGGFGGVDGDA